MSILCGEMITISGQTWITVCTYSNHHSWEQQTHRNHGITMALHVLNRVTPLMLWVTITLQLFVIIFMVWAARFSQQHI